MTGHTVLTEGCYRCDLNRDEMGFEQSTQTPAATNPGSGDGPRQAPVVHAASTAAASGVEPDKLPDRLRNGRVAEGGELPPKGNGGRQLAADPAATTGTCPSRTSQYVPWTFGQTYECTVCGRRAQQSHRTLPISDGRRSYASIYPFPEHDAKP